MVYKHKHTPLNLLLYPFLHRSPKPEPEGPRAERQKGREAKRQRGREAERQSGREAERQRQGCKDARMQGRRWVRRKKNI